MRERQSTNFWVARRPKIGIEISISVSGSIGTESWKSASNSAVGPRPPRRDNSSRSENVPRYLASALKVGKTDRSCKSSIARLR